MRWVVVASCSAAGMLGSADLLNVHFDDCNAVMVSRGGSCSELRPHGGTAIIALIVTLSGQAESL